MKAFYEEFLLAEPGRSPEAILFILTTKSDAKASSAYNATIARFQLDLGSPQNKPNLNIALNLMVDP